MKKDESLLWIRNHVEVPKAKAALLIAGNIVFSVCGVVFALLCRGAVDHAVNGDMETMLGSAAGLAVIVLLQLFLRLLCNSIEEGVRARIETDLRSEMLEKLIKKEYSGISGFRGEELLNRMFSDISIVSDGIVCIFPAFVNMTSRLVCAAAVIMLLDAELAALLIAAGAVFFLVSRILGKRIKKLRRSVGESEENAQLLMRETFDELLTVKTGGADNKVIRMNREKQDSYYNARMRRHTTSIAAGAGFTFAFQASYLYAVIWSSFGILNSTMTFGTLIALLQLINQIQTPLAGLSAIAVRYNSMLCSAARLMETELLPDETPAVKTLGIDEFEKLSAENVCFSYGENQVISEASFEIRRGDIVSLTGVSGSEKTAVFRLLLGTEQPQSGAVRFLSNKDEYAPGVETRGLIAYVSEKSGLFSGTIGENIAFLNETARTDEIRSAAKTACALELIEGLPDGFETRIGENGTDISEGMKQRITVARAILSGAPLIILDNATGAIDEVDEAKILDNIAGLKSRTVIAAVHRYSSLKVCTRHLTIQDGSIFEEKTYDLLFSRRIRQ